MACLGSQPADFPKLDDRLFNRNDQHVLETKHHVNCAISRRKAAIGESRYGRIRAEFQLEIMRPHHLAGDADVGKARRDLSQIASPCRSGSRKLDREGSVFQQQVFARA
jgi:hypothetical protein